MCVRLRVWSLQATASCSIGTQPITGTTGSVDDTVTGGNENSYFTVTDTGNHVIWRGHVYDNVRVNLPG